MVGEDSLTRDYFGENASWCGSTRGWASQATNRPMKRFDSKLKDCVDRSTELNYLISDGGTDFPSKSNTREYTLAEADYECELCGTSGDEEQLKIYHRIQQNDGGTNDSSGPKFMCRPCHGRHHDFESEHKKTLDEVDEEPLPPYTEPNETDIQIVDVIEDHGGLNTKTIANKIGCSKQYVRRECWKLSGELLIGRTNSGEWELRESIHIDDADIGLPETPITAYKAGRDETIRQMAAYGLSTTEIEAITDLSRSTIDIAIYRARARAIVSDIDDTIDIDSLIKKLAVLTRLIQQAIEREDVD